MSTDRQPMPSTIRTSVRGRYVSVKSSINSGGNVRVDVLLDRCSNFSKAWRCHRADPKQHRFAVLLVCYSDKNIEENRKTLTSVTAFLREYLDNYGHYCDDPIMCPQLMFVAERRSCSSSFSSTSIVQSLARLCNIPHVTVRCPVYSAPARHLITSHLAACSVMYYIMVRQRARLIGMEEKNIT
eukprot:PhM_4_TR18416/c0_g1_i1/m.24658